MTHFEEEVLNTVGNIASLLIEKHTSYGESALNPIRALGSGSALQLLGARADDKISRLMNGNFSMETKEETIKDLMGYLVLYLIELKRIRNCGEKSPEPHTGVGTPKVVVEHTPTSGIPRYRLGIPAEAL